MSKLSHVITFLSGSIISGTVVWLYSKKHYERIAQEEIDSVKEVFSAKEKTAETIKPEKKEKPNTDMVEYMKKIKKEGYVNYSKDSNKKDINGHPYVISPDEFGEIEEYETISLTFYDDKILTDDNNEIIENIEETVGFESLTHFGEYEDDSVFVRNDRLKCDYEILLDLRTYHDVIREQRRPTSGRSYFENKGFE